MLHLQTILISYTKIKLRNSVLINKYFWACYLSCKQTEEMKDNIIGKCYTNKWPTRDQQQMFILSCFIIFLILSEEKLSLHHMKIQCYHSTTLINTTAMCRAHACPYKNILLHNVLLFFTSRKLCQTRCFFFFLILIKIIFFSRLFFNFYQQQSYDNNLCDWSSLLLSQEHV